MEADYLDPPQAAYLLHRSQLVDYLDPPQAAYLLQVRLLRDRLKHRTKY